MKEFFEFLKSLIDASGKFGNVFLENDIPDKTRRGEHRATKRRSVFIEFSVQEVMHKSLGINEFDLIVRMTVANDNKKFSKLEDMTLLDDLNAIIQNKYGGVDNKYRFSSMNRIMFEYDNNHDQVSEPANEYSTKLTDYTGYKYKNLVEGIFSAVSFSVEVVDKISEPENC